ncbi:hypothetical protein EJB05_50576 [Eragrostis curvula]|uniref:RNase III domain-containing protein n=1 Tax=Eragrostis curvula TaxID=38414 RepID=A0A5J9SXY5_9POAL|nr:hypothetical protein EJB05_50576 [Eragrostis curvula]
MAPAAADAQEEDARCEDEPSTSGDGYQHDQPVYFPEELVGDWLSFSRLGLYYSYTILLRGCFDKATAPTDIILAVRCDLGPEFICNSFDMGGVQVTIQYAGIIHLNEQQVNFARRFQTTILSLLISKDHLEVSDAIKGLHDELQASVGVVYLLLPSISGKIDWCKIKFSSSPAYDEATGKNVRHSHACEDAHLVQTKDGLFCTCMLQNCVVYTPQDKIFHSVTGFVDLDANNIWHLEDGSTISSRKYLKTRYSFFLSWKFRFIHVCSYFVCFIHGLNLTCETQRLLAPSELLPVQNCFHKSYKREPRDTNAVELPPELCKVVMAPVSANTLCIFTFVPSIMYRIQCLLLSVKLKIQLGPTMQQFNIKALKIMEALTTKACQEAFSLESLETLGDSFLKYVTSQHLFSKHMDLREDVLTDRRISLVSNTNLCQLACSRKLVGYIRGEEFKTKCWIIPGLYDKRGNSNFSFQCTNNMYSLKKISITSDTIADTVEALIGACLSLGGEHGELAAFHFIKSLGMDIELHIGMNDERKLITKSGNIEESINARCSDLEAMLGYVFNDRLLLVEALAHGSYKTVGTTACNQRLEFLGDSILDYIITVHFFKLYYPDCTPGLLTDLRRASVNNHCYAHASVKNGLHKYILYSDKQMVKTINDLENSGRSFSGPSHGIEPGSGLPKYLADLIESIAGAIYLDSRCNKEEVWRAMKRLLEPLPTSDTMECDPLTELKELCEQRSYLPPLYSTTRKDGVTTAVAEVQVAGTQHYAIRTGIGCNKDVTRVAAKALLQDLKALTLS